MASLELGKIITVGQDWFTDEDYFGCGLGS
jgi:hypothetical protein